jgi:hypothetical protein
MDWEIYVWQKGKNVSVSFGGGCTWGKSETPLNVLWNRCWGAWKQALPTC